MRRLLPLSLDGQIRWFPLADRSALAIQRAILGISGQGPSLPDALALDPPWLIWAVWAQWLESGELAPGLDQTVAWLQDRLPDLLVPGECESPVDDVPQAPFLAQVEQDLVLSELAADLAAPQGEELAQQARFLGLLQHAEAWLALTGSPAERPPWLDQLATLPAAPVVARARELLFAAGSETDSKKRPVQEARRRAQSLAQQWAAEVPYPADLLWASAARLAELAQLRQHFDERLEEEKLAAMAEFAAGAGHEINNPLTVIAGRAQLFLRQEKDPERRRELALINAQAMRVYEMIADMRLFARPPEPKPKPCDLVDLADRAVSELAGRAAEQETVLRRLPSAGPIPLMADPVQIVVAIKALCANSLEALRHGGHVDVEASAQPGGATLRVTDDGPGMGPEERRHLFDPFFSARQAGRGLGMGLCKCWRIVEHHGGRIEVQTEPGRGAVLTIHLPRAED